MKKKLLLLLTISSFIINGCGQKKDNKAAPESVKHFPLSTGDYIVNVVESKLIWTGKEVSTKEHYGTINIKSGRIAINDNGMISGDIEIDMSTINTTDLTGRGKQKLDGHLKSPDFFDVNQYPNAYLKFQGDEKKFSSEQLKFDGQLTIKDITHPISFISKIKDSDGKLTANAQVIFNRSLYDVRFRSGKFFENLGDKLIYDDITVDVLIVSTK
tara:strand:+ start:931 stop:1572 length:642 start_codon:yes stop_codon:yes gene_type:complete